MSSSLRRSARTPHPPVTYKPEVEIKHSPEKKLKKSAEKRKKEVEEQPTAPVVPNELQGTSKTLAEALEESSSYPVPVEPVNADFSGLLTSVQFSGMTVREALSGKNPLYNPRTKRKRIEGDLPGEGGYNDSDPQANIQNILNGNGMDASFMSHSDPSVLFGGNNGANLQLLTNYPYEPFFTTSFSISRQLPNSFEVNGQKYVRVTNLVYMRGFAVPIDHEFSLMCENIGLYSTTLRKLLFSNGVAINDPKDVAEIISVLCSSQFLIHHSIADNLIAVQLDGPTASKEKENIPVHVSRIAPPFVCTQPAMITMQLGRPFGPNLLFDARITAEKEGAIPLLQPVVPEPPAVDYSQQMISHTDANLSLRDKLMLIVQHDMGVKLPKDLHDSVLSQRVQIVREQTRHYLHVLMQEEEMKSLRRITEGAGPPVAKHVRKSTTSECLNLVVWKFYEDCMETKTDVNGKTLRDFARAVTAVVGLKNFNASEGWLDSFKKRHKIDTKMLIGRPVDYDESDAKKIVRFLTYLENTSPSEDNSNIYDGDETMSTPKDFNALIASVEAAYKNSVATVNIENTVPLDISSFLGGDHATGSMNGQVGSSTNGDENYEESRVTQAMEVSSALETIREYIASNDPSAMDLFTQLQTKLLTVNQEEGQQTDSNQ